MPIALGRPRVIRWKLNEVMARYRLTNSQLGGEIDRHETSVSRLRSSDEMPRLSGADLNKLCGALTRLSGEIVGVEELLEYVVDED